MARKSPCFALTIVTIESQTCPIVSDLGSGKIFSSLSASCTIDVLLFALLYEFVIPNHSPLHHCWGLEHPPYEHKNIICEPESLPHTNRLPRQPLPALSLAGYPALVPALPRSRVPLISTSVPFVHHSATAANFDSTQSRLLFCRETCYRRGWNTPSQLGRRPCFHISVPRHGDSDLRRWRREVDSFPDGKR